MHIRFGSISYVRVWIHTVYTHIHRESHSGKAALLRCNSPTVLHSKCIHSLAQPSAFQDILPWALFP